MQFVRGLPFLLQRTWLRDHLPNNHCWYIQYHSEGRTLVQGVHSPPPGGSLAPYMQLVRGLPFHSGLIHSEGLTSDSRGVLYAVVDK